MGLRFRAYTTRFGVLSWGWNCLVGLGFRVEASTTRFGVLSSGMEGLGLYILYGLGF